MSIHLARSRRLGVAVLALITSFLVVLTGLVAAPSAFAAGAPSLQSSEAPREGGVVTVSGIGFDATNADGIYVGFGPEGLPGFYEAQAG